MKDGINIEIINDKELTQLFSELVPAVQNKIVIGGIREASKPIVKQAKINLKRRTNIKKTTGVNGVKIQKLRNKIGVKIGLENYKLRWLNWGTDKREYTTKNGNKHNTGKIQPTNFFFDAVEQHQEESNKIISKSIKKSLEKTIKRYNKMY